MDVEICNLDDVRGVDAIIAAVAHEAYVAMAPAQLRSMTNNGSAVLIDVKSMYDRERLEAEGFRYWCL